MAEKLREHDGVYESIHRHNGSSWLIQIRKVDRPLRSQLIMPHVLTFIKVRGRLFLSVMQVEVRMKNYTHTLLQYCKDKFQFAR